MPKLRITIGDESFDRDLTKPLSVAGRNPDLEIPLPTVSASREHFRIGRLKDGTWAIEDLGSTNGTFINGKKVTKARLHHNDAIQIGRDCKLVFSDPPAPAAKRSVPVAKRDRDKPKRPKGPIVVKSRAQRLKEEQEAERLRKRAEKKKLRQAAAAAQGPAEADRTAEVATPDEPQEDKSAGEIIEIENEAALQKILRSEGGVQAIWNRGAQVVFGNYELVKKLSEGGMGVVFKAKHRKKGNRVALKLLRGAMVDEENIQRFKQEAWAISAFNHPNIIQVTDLGEVGRMHYIAMEFIDGEDLLAVGIRRDLTYWQVTEIIAKLASVLKLVHGKNIWHRDIKPQNILLDRAGGVKLIDFGIATIEREQEDAAKTGEGLIMGTPAFLSPEQAARGKMGAIDGRADIYSLGAVFYYMLTGRRPFTGRSALEILSKNMKEPPPHPHDIDHLIPSGLVQICLKMLEKDPADRHQSAEALLSDIARWRKHKQGRSSLERHKKIVELKAKKAAREKSGS